VQPPILRSVPLPTIDLAQPTLIARPVHHEGWVYEEKVDGYCIVAYKTGGRVRLVSRQGRDHTAFPWDCSRAPQPSMPPP
jgi:ATP-dependent DNA ligase